MMIGQAQIVTRRAPMSPTAPGVDTVGSLGPLPAPLSMAVGAPVLADGAHCPFCLAPMYIGRDIPSLVCLVHGGMSDEVYGSLWRRLASFTIKAVPTLEDIDDEPGRSNLGLDAQPAQPAAQL